MHEPPGHPTSNVSLGKGQRRTTARAARLVVVVLCSLVALALIALSLVPYERLKEYVDAFTVDRDANVTAGEFDAIVQRIRVLAASFGALAAALLTFGSTFDRVISDIGGSWWASIRRAPRLLHSWLGNESRPYLAAGASILLIGIAVRIAYIDLPVRYDEATTYNNFVSKPLHIALANYATPNNHLLHTLLAKLSVGALGNEEWALRLPALVAGFAIVPATFAYGRVVLGRVAALLAAALVASSSTLVEYSTNARGYTLVALATLVVLLAATRAIDSDSVGAWAVVAVAGALGLYAVPIMVYALGGAFLWIVVSATLAGWPQRRLLTRLGATAIGATVLTLLLYAPVYAASGIRSVTANEFVEPRSWSTFVDFFPGHLDETLGTWARDLPLAVTIVLAVSFVAGFMLTPWLSRFPIPALLTIAAWSAVVLIAQRVVPYTRVWLFVVPLVAVTVAGLYGWLIERRRWGEPAGSALAVAVAIAGSLFMLETDSVRTTRETGALLDAPAIADFLAQRVEPGDRILATGSDTILEYYLGRKGIDANGLLYDEQPRNRTFVVVNTLGGQTVDDLLLQLQDPEAVGRAVLLTAFDSGQVYLVEPAA